MNKEKKSPVFAAFGMATSIGLNIVATIAVGIVGGRMADSYFSTTPWLTVGGIVLGIIAGLWATYKRIMKQS